MSRLSLPLLRRRDASACIVRRSGAASLVLLLASGCVDDEPTRPGTRTLAGAAGPRLVGVSATEIDIGDLGSGGSVYVHDMNDAGQIVGNAWKSTNDDAGPGGFFWEPGRTMQWIAGYEECEELDKGASYCWIAPGAALALNAGGMVTGAVEGEAYRWPRSVQSPIHLYSLGRDINDAGDIVGGSQAFLWTSDDLVTWLGTLPGQSESHAVRINNTRQVAGKSGPRGFFWQNGTMQDLGTLGGASTQPIDMNEAGQVVGHSSVGGDAAVHAFLWTQAGGMQDLGTLGGANSHANAINSRGQVVGWAETAGGARHAFVWTAAEGMVDLGTLPVIHIPWRPEPDPALSSSEALDINDAGVVTGFSRAGYVHPFAYVWSPASGMQLLGDGYGRVINNHNQVAGGSVHPTENLGGNNRGRFWHNIVLRVGTLVDAGGPYRGSQGQAILFDGSHTTNPDGDSLAFAWDFTGDGVPDSSGVQVGFAFAAAGTYTVRLFVTDAVGVTRTDDATVTVGPARWPRAVIAPPPGGQYTIREGTRITLSSQGSAGENGGPLLYRWEFGDGTRAQSRFQTTPFTWGKVYGDDGTYTARLIVRDTAGRADTATINVVVSNTAPRAVFGTSSNVFENSSFTLSLLSATDSSAADRQAGFTYAFDCGKGGGYGAFSVSASRTCEGQDDTTYTVGARIRDKDGGVRQYTRALAIRNARPVVIFAIMSGTLLNASFTDAGPEDGPWRWVVRWGDGTRSEGWTSLQGYGAILAPHTYAAPGTYTVQINVHDKDLGASDAYSLTFTR